MHTGFYFLPQKPIAVFLLFLIVATLVFGQVLLPLKTAQAQWAVVDALNAVWEGIMYVYTQISDAVSWAYDAVMTAYDVWSESDTLLQRALKVAWDYLRKKLLDMLVDDIIKWINGDQSSPMFVTDWQGFLKKAADQAGGQFVQQYLGQGWLCRTFDVRLNFALSTAPPFNIAASCTLSQIGTNIDNFFKNFSNGGWKGWLTITENQNNVYGAYLMAMDKKIDLADQAAKAAQNAGVSSAGFLGDKRCIESYYIDPDGDATQAETIEPTKQADLAANETCTKWTTYTPGKVAAEATVKAANIDIDWLISAQEFEQYLGAIIDAVINRVAKEGLAKMTTPTGGSAGQTGAGISTAATAATAGVSVSSFTGALQGGNAATSTLSQLSLFKENLNTYSGQLQTTLGVLNQVKSAQIGALGILQQMVSASCALPAGANQTTLSTQTNGSCNGTVCPCTQTTITTIRTSAPGLGSVDTQTTVTSQWADTPCDPTIQFCAAPTICAYSNGSVSQQQVGSAVAIDPELASVNSAISTVQPQINNIDAALADVQNYSQAAAKYQNTFQSFQTGGATQAQLTADENAMNAFKTKAIASLQAALNSTSSDLQTLLQEVQTASIALVQKNGDVQLRRGVSASCTTIQAGTYYADLCAAQAAQTSYQTAYTTCLQQNNGGGGG